MGQSHRQAFLGKDRLVPSYLACIWQVEIDLEVEYQRTKMI